MIRDPQPWSHHLAATGSLEALYSPDLPNRESAHWHFTSTDAVHEPVQAGVRWANTVPLAGVWVHFRAGWRPRAWRLGVERPDGAIEWHAGPTHADALEVPLRGAQAVGVIIELPPTGGPLGQPARLRIEAIAPRVVGVAPSPVVIERDGARHTPRLPLATDGNAHTALEISDADALWITPPWPVDGLTLVFTHLAGSGGPAQIRAWLAQLSFAGQRHLDVSNSGLAAGETRAVLRFAAPQAGPIRLEGPGRPRVLALRHLRFAVEPGGEAVPMSAPAAPPPDADAWAARFAEQRSWRWATLDQMGPRNHALSLGVPGATPRAGVTPLGDLAIRRGPGHANALRVVFGAADQPLRWQGAVDAHAPVLRRRSGAIAQTLWVEPNHTLLVETRLPARQPLQVALACAEGLRPTTPRWTTRPVEGALEVHEAGRLVLRAEGAWTAERTAHELRLHHRAARPTRLWLRIPLTERFDVPTTIAGITALRAATRRTLGPMAHYRLPPQWQRLVEGLWTQAALFVQADQVAYGLWPSVYADDVFGLEEDYLFQALSQWGGTQRALALFRATYLTPAHLDKRHYLHDLRNGLTPWQLERLLRRAGTPWQALSTPEQLQIRALAQWITQGRAQTAEATGDCNADGVRVFPGLLPPFRYGGDLGFETQSLYVNAINQVGLRAVAELTGEAPLAAEAEAYRGAVLAALDAVRDGETQPLRSSGPDPGDYYQLMACGLLDPVDFFAPGDPRAARIDAQVAREGRLFMALPRFDGWGAPPGIDAVYALGYLLNALRAGHREVFWTGLLALARVAGDPDTCTFKEVGPIGLGGVDPAPFLPGRRLSRSEPCVGSLGIVLQLVRHAFVCPMPDATGRLGGRLLIGAGLPPDWWHHPLDLLGVATLGGPVSLKVRPGPVLEIDAPEAQHLEICWPDGRRTHLPPGHHRGITP
jgi:hypothetical protein